MADHFVDKDASGANDGSSWTDAWTSVGSITGLSAGDTVYISGGTTSKTYTPGDGLPANGIWTISTDGTINNRITFQTGQDANHNGTVIFDWASVITNDTTLIRGAIVVTNRDFLTFSGNVGGAVKWSFRNLYDINTRLDGTVIYADAATTGITVEYCDFQNVNIGVRLTGNGMATTEIANCTSSAVRGDAVVTTNGHLSSSTRALIHDNTFYTYRINGQGPDGISVGNWADVYDNYVESLPAPGGVQTSDQHNDLIQISGNNVNILRNELVSPGDAAVTLLSTQSTSALNITIENNLFRMTNPLAGQKTEYIRVIRQSLETMNGLKIRHNTFIDNPDSVAYREVDDPGYAAVTGSGNEFINNCIYQVGNGTSYVDAAAFWPNNSVSWTISGNNWFNDREAAARIRYKGTTYTFANFVTNIQGGTGNTTEPDFTSYAFLDANNDLAPSENDTALREQGVSSDTTEDFFGTTRPIGSDPDIGAIEGALVGGSPIIAATPTSIDFGVAEADVGTPSDTITVENVGGGTLTGTASTAAPFSVDSPSGGNYSTESAESVTVSFNPTTEGRFTDNIDFTGGGGDAVAVEGIGYIVETGLELFAYEDGTLVAPFAVSAGSHISQSSQTSLNDGGVWVVGFNIDTEGIYRFSAVVNAPSTGSNSFWFAVDAVPTSNTQVWDIVSLTSGFKTRLVTRRGSGTPTNPQFSPYELTLGTGSHYLCLIGRESNCLLRSIEVTLVSSSVPTSPGSPPIRPRNSGLILWGM